MEQQFDNQNEIKQDISSQQQTEIEKDERANQQLTSNYTSNEPTNQDINLQNDKNWGRSLIKSITITCVDSVTKKPIDGSFKHDRKYLKLWKELMSNDKSY